MKKLILTTALLLGLAANSEATEPLSASAGSYPTVKSKCLTDKPNLKIDRQVYALTNLFYFKPRKGDPTFGMKDNERLACNNILNDVYIRGFVGKQDLVEKMSITQKITLDEKKRKFIFSYTGSISVYDYMRSGGYKNKLRTEAISGKFIVDAM